MKTAHSFSKPLKKGILPLIFMLLGFAALANGLGVSPAFKTIYFLPNATINLEFDIINSEGNSFEASLESYGDIQELAFFENKKIQVSASEYTIPFKVILKLPSEMQPGIRTGGIKITPSLGLETGQTLAVYVAPQIPIHLKVPYSFKYADVSVVFISVDEGTPVPIYVEFDNMGSDDIITAGAVVEIYDPEGLLLANVSAPDISVARGTLGKTQAHPAPILTRGLYSSVIKAYYDGIEKNMTANFTVGEPLIRVEGLMVKNLVKDEINRIIFKVSNEWNTELSAGGFLELDGKKEELPSFKIGKGQAKEIIGFFDTTGFSDGDYAIKITLAYANQLKTDIFPVTIGGKGEVTKIQGLLNSPTIIILCILIIIVIAVIIILLINKKRKEKVKGLL